MTRNTSTFHLLFCVLVFLNLVQSKVQAGGTTITSTDGATAYQNGTEVVVGSNAMVTLDTTCTTGNGEVNCTYTPSSGVYLYPDDSNPSGSYSTEEKAVFMFDDTTPGQINSIGLNVSHNSDTPAGNACLPNGANFTFRICIPLIKIVLKPGATPINYNYAYQQDFQDIITIAGVDDPAQISFVQEVSEAVTATDLNDGTQTTTTVIPAGTIDWPGIPGQSDPNPSGPEVPNGAANWPFDVSPAFDVLEPPYDDHNTSVTQSAFLIGETSYYYTRFFKVAWAFQDFVTRPDKTTVLDQYNWSYDWDNYNATFPTSGTPTLSDLHANTTHNYAAYIGTALTGSGEVNSGEYSNPMGITLP